MLTPIEYQSIAIGLSTVFFMIDWEAHERSLNRPYGEHEEREIQYAFNRFLKKIEHKYRDQDDPESKQREIDELIAFTEKLKNHLKIRKRISKDPEQQSDVEKLIVSAPPWPKNKSIVHNYLDSRVRDSKTGMHWSHITGMPSAPPEWFEEFLNSMHADMGGHVWDDTRSWWYNVFMKFFPGSDA